MRWKFRITQVTSTKQRNTTKLNERNWKHIKGTKEIEWDEKSESLKLSQRNKETQQNQMHKIKTKFHEFENSNRYQKSESLKLLQRNKETQQN